MKLIVGYAFQGLGLHRLYSRILADNARSIKACEKAGFQIEAHLRDSVCLDGKYRDLVLVGVVNQ